VRPRPHDDDAVEMQLRSQHVVIDNAVRDRGQVVATRSIDDPALALRGRSGGEGDGLAQMRADGVDATAGTRGRVSIAWRTNRRARRRSAKSANVRCDAHAGFRLAPIQVFEAPERLPSMVRDDRQ